MKICIYSLNFYPEVGAEPNRLYQIAKRLVSYGHDVTVRTFIPNYPSYKIYNGYRYKLYNKETIDGIEVIQTCMLPPMKGKYYARIANIFSYTVSSVLFNPSIFKKHDIFLYNSMPIFMVPPAILSGKLSRAKIIMNAGDVWPGVVKKLDYGAVNPVSYKIMSWLEKMGYNNSNLVTLSTVTSMNEICERFSNVKTSTIPCGVDTELFVPQSNTKVKYGYKESDFVIGFCGLHGWMHGLPNVIEAALRLRNVRDIKFLFVGDGPVKDIIVSKANKYKLENVRFMDFVANTDVPDIMSCFDVGLVPMASERAGVISAKIYELLALGIPILEASGCEAANMVEKYNLGRVYKANDYVDLAKSIYELYIYRDNMHHISVNNILLSKKFDYNIIAKHVEDICFALKDGKEVPQYTW